MNLLLVAVSAFLLLSMTSVRAALSSSDSIHVKGKVLDSAGRTLPGTTVQLFIYSPSIVNGFELNPTPEVITDANGGFDLPVSRNSGLPQTPTFLIAHKPGLAATWIQFALSNGTEQTVVLPPASFLAGQVLDETETPVAGAQVSVSAAYLETTTADGSRNFSYLADKPARSVFTTKTGPDGSFRLEGFPTNTTAALIAEAPGKVLRGANAGFLSPDSLPFRAGQGGIRLILEPAGSIEGTIAFPDAGNVPIAQLRLLPAQPGTFVTLPPAIRPGNNGAFRFDTVAPGAYRIQATFGTNATPEWIAEPVSVTVESKGVSRGVRLTATRGGLLEVSVRAGKEGTPLHESNVNVFREGYQSGAIAGTNGIAVLRLPPGEYQVVAFKTGYQQSNVSGTVQTSQTNRIEIELEKSRKLAGIVRLPDGQLGTKLPVQVLGDYSMQQTPFFTGADGRFEIDWNPQQFGGDQASPCLVVRYPEKNLAVAQDVDAETESYELKLAPALTFVLRIQSDGKPLTNAAAALLFRSGNMSMYVNGLAKPTSIPGELEIPALPPGRQYGIQCSAPGYGTRFLDVAQQAEEAKRVELDTVELKRADRKLAGKLVDPEDKPVSSAMVQIHGDGQPNANTRTDSEGRFSFDVCEGTVRLFANSARMFANRAAEAGDTNVVLTLGEQMGGGDGGAKPQRLAGTANDAGGKPVAGAEVRVFPMHMPMPAKTEADGTFKVSYVVEPWQRQNGNPLLLVRDRTRNLAIAQELVDENTNVTVQLEQAWTVKGHIVDSAGKPVPNATANLILQSGNMGGQIDNDPTTTDSRGGFTFTTLPTSQRYTIYASAPGYSQKSQRLPGESETSVIDLAPIVLRLADKLIAGRVLDAKDKPIAGIYVQVSSDDQPQVNMQTDSKGRFKFKVCDGTVRLYASGQAGFSQTTVQAGDTNISLVLMDQSSRRTAARRKHAPASRPNVSALVGKPLPNLTTLGFTSDAAPANRPLLLCLLDIQQRPSRRMARLLKERQEELHQQGVAIAVAQTAQASDEAWNDWREAYSFEYPLARLTSVSDASHWATSLGNLPWLILIDHKGIVSAEGFSLDELKAKIESLAK